MLPLRNMSPLFSKIFSGGKKSGSVIGVDIGSSAIKVVQLAKQGDVAILETYGALALGPYAKTDIGRATNLAQSELTEALKNLMSADAARVSARRGAVAIPLNASLITVIQMPELPEDELNRMIPIEARKYIPVPINEVMLSGWPIPRSDDAEENTGGGKKTKFVDVLIAAVHNEAFSKYSGIVGDAGIEVSFYEIEAFSTIRSVIEQTAKPATIVDIGASSTKIYIIESGIVRGSHITNRGAQEVTTSLARSLGLSGAEAEQLKRRSGLEGDPSYPKMASIITSTLEYMLVEVRRIISDFEQKQKKTMGQVILTGGGSVLKGLLLYAQKQFSAEVLLGDPFNKVEAPAFVTDVLRKAGPEFAVAVGAALRLLQEDENP